MRIFKNTWFARFAEKESITDSELKETVNQLEEGQIDADLGGGVYKMRVARPGEGKSRGYRVIIFFKSEERAFFVYSFAKSDRDNIDHGELRAFRADARVNFSLTDEQIIDRLKKGTLIEII
ncbi:MAG: type II toxin-antitoxin system RelE/ParE family toxin [Treponema sp.]|nr:type II toxin-antitoxin system RelE/ParE family toxin [Treponema sp.]